VAILGQGIVGCLCAQIIRERNPSRVIVVDAQQLRCEIAEKLGPDVVINVSETDSVAEIRRLTDGNGADLVVECVGGNAGIRSFEQAQQMLAAGGAIHLIAKYQGGPLPFDGDSFMNKVLVAGIRIDQSREECTEEAARMLADGRVRVSELITHRLPWEQTPDAYHMLYEKPNEALGVILEWD
jgi:L-iditol 2-dehydrogenase